MVSTGASRRGLPSTTAGELRCWQEVLSGRKTPGEAGRAGECGPDCQGNATHQRVWAREGPHLVCARRALAGVPQGPRGWEESRQEVTRTVQGEHDSGLGERRIEDPRPRAGPDVGRGSGLSSATLMPLPPPEWALQGRQALPTGLLVAKFGVIVIKRGTQRRRG